jgi:hypothetical protein
MFFLPHKLVLKLGYLRLISLLLYFIIFKLVLDLLSDFYFLLKILSHLV